MKTNLISLIMTLFVGCASAQQKLWEWKPATKADARSIHATALAENGAGAFIIGETDIKGTFVSEHDYGPYGQSWYVIQWVDNKGRPLLSKRLRTKDDFYTVQQIRGYSKWALGFMGPLSLGVYDGSKLRIYTLKNGKVFESQRIIPAFTTISVFPVSNFPGWVEQESIRAGSYTVHSPDDGSDSQSSIYDINGVSLWRP
jgi:hypothetical protein